MTLYPRSSGRIQPKDFLTRQVITLNFNFRDPFFWQKFSGRIKYSDIDLTTVNRFDSRSITLNFSYRFGKSTVAQARRRQSGATEEQNRAGGAQGGG